FRRRFTPELVDYAVGPFVAGIYAGDPEQLLVSETFPSLIAYERDYGSVLRGFIKNQSSAVRKQSFSFTDGMQMLPNALASRLTNLSLNDPVQKIRRVGSGWRVTGVSGITTVDQLVLATGTDAAARLVQSYNPELARSLWAINYPYMTAVHSVYRRTDVSHPLNGFGGLNPKKENRFCAGHIWSSSLFAGRCPTDEVLFTTFVGGSQSPDNARQPDEVIFENVHRELAGSFGISASAPVFRDLYRWERAIPQYDAKLAALKPLVAAAVGDQLRVCANWYGGLSLPDCIGKARAMAGEIETKSLINKF
ncbi:MAG: protoporphyrinogen oxidase, partial [Spirosoma sp.]|nr:protoporphyrinogen oxidase [Spirosoma sp.]